MGEKEKKTENERAASQALRLPKRRIVIAGTGSGCGKTTVTSGLLWCLKQRGMEPAAFKCGPDYIDPMFHEKVLGARSGNLDLFFSDAEMLRFLAACGSEGCDIGVAEGVMGYYDGIGMTSEASTWQVADALAAPAVLVINARGMASSVMAILEGFVNHKENSRIRGVIFNRLSEKLYLRLAEQVRALGIVPLGYLPPDGRVEIQSRHLGLVTAGEIRDIQEKMRTIGEWMAETVDIEGIIRLSEEAGDLEAPIPECIASVVERRSGKGNGVTPRIAVAADEAFCFSYASNFMLLEKLGAELIEFSPLHDEKLPEDIDGIILSGGYPELYGKKLEENGSMRDAVRRAAEQNMPILAECGGFMYLHRRIEGAVEAETVPAAEQSDHRSADRPETGPFYEMAGVVDGDCFRGKRLGNFGYLNLTARSDGMIADSGERLKAHEFHYWKSTAEGNSFEAGKADGSRSWDSGFSGENLYAGFPHLFFCSSPESAERFIKKCCEYRSRRETG